MALVYSVSAGPAVDADVVSRELTVAVNGEQISRVSFPKETTDFGEIKVAQDSNVSVALVDIDDAGNRSQPALREFVATDTIPPAAPGEIGVSLLREDAS
jgi:hypothetical protein